MAEFKRCFGCMTELRGGSICPHCGYENGSGRVSSLHIAPGTLLKGRYVVGKAIGQGGFGITYIAWDNVFNRAAAIKEYLPPSLATRNTDGPSVTCASANLKEDYEYGLRKFLDEARILAMFGDMPNIVDVRDFFRANGTAYMVMEYVDGITFKEYIARRGGRVSWEEAEGILSFVADALRAVHSQGLLHRDVSPDNIYITESKQIKLLDFGAARLALEAQNRGFSVVLKHGYAPAEQYKTNGSQGPWTDIYALAATFYAGVAGRLPPDAMDRLEHDGLIPPSALGVEIPPAKERALMKALAIREEDRFRRVEDFMAALKEDAPHAEAAAEPVRPPHVEAPKRQARIRKETKAGAKPSFSLSDGLSRRLPYVLVCAALAIVLVFVFKNGFVPSWAEMQSRAPKKPAAVAAHSSPVPSHAQQPLPAPQPPAPSPVQKIAQKKLPAAQPVKKTESAETKQARLEVEKARRELAEEKKREAEREAVRRGIKVHTGAAVGANMLLND